MTWVSVLTKSAPYILSGAAMGLTWLMSSSDKGGTASGASESKKEMTGSTETHAPQEHYQTSTTTITDDSTTNTNIYNSSGVSVDTKKSATATSTPDMTSDSGFRQLDASPGAGAAAAGGSALGDDPTAIGGGTDLIMLAVIGGAAWVAYGYVSGD